MYDIIKGNAAYSGYDSDLARLLAVAGAQLDEEGTSHAATRALQDGAVVLRSGHPTKAREYPLGFDTGATVAAATAFTTTSQPQVIFRPERLVVPSDIGGSFTISDLIVGKNSQFASTTPCPARVFDENAVGVRLRGDTCQVSMNLTITGVNISGAAIRFRAAVIGTAVE